MNEKREHLTRLVQDTFATRDDEIQCEEARTWMARCASELLSNEEAQQLYPQLWHHFQFCSDCAQEYQMVMDLAQLEADGQLEQPGHIPPPPQESKPAIWPRAKDIITAIFTGFSPELAGALTRGIDLTIESVEMVLDEQRELRVTFDAAANEQKAGLVDLFCTVSATDPGSQPALEGAPVWLQTGDEGPVIQEKALNELGDVVFTHLSSGTYMLRLYLGKREYIIKDIALP